MDIAFNPADYPTYNIGDKVTIRQWDDMASEFGLNVFGDIKVPKACFTEPMRKYCGKTLTIVRKNHYLFLPSERINHYDQTYLHPRYHQRYCLL